MILSVLQERIQKLEPLQQKFLTMKITPHKWCCISADHLVKCCYYYWPRRVCSLFVMWSSVLTSWVFIHRCWQSLWPSMCFRVFLLFSKSKCVCHSDMKMGGLYILHKCSGGSGVGGGGEGVGRRKVWDNCKKKKTPKNQNLWSDLISYEYAYQQNCNWSQIFSVCLNNLLSW